ncbi:ABC transporter substrate-binding protein [Lysinibacillus fusiformis]|nr:ABC transporter substrate-binding protein [Lysinibacillus fusiformis]
MMIERRGTIKMNGKDHTLLWDNASIKVLDVRRKILRWGEDLRNYKMPSNGFIFISRGQAQVQLDHIEYIIQQFQVIHSGKGTILDIILTENELEYYLIFYKASIPSSSRQEILRLLETNNPFHLQYSFVPSYPISLFHRVKLMEQEWNRAEALDRFYVKSLFYQFIYSVLKQLQRQEVDVIEPDLVAQVVMYIQEHYAQSITLESISANLNYSVPHVSSLFKKKTGYSVIDYLIRTRLDIAAKLLVETDATLKEIALSIGYKDPYYFSRLFKKYKGVSPLRFRKREVNLLQEVDSPQNAIGLSIVWRQIWRYIDSDNHYQYSGEEDLHMHRGSKASLAATALLCITLLLSACTGGAANLNNETTGQNQTVLENQAASSSETRVYKDSQGTEIDIPTKPEQIVLQGNAIGDLLALGIEPVGVDHRFIDSGVLENKGKISATDIGFPTNLEKVLSLNPDLIMLSYVMDKEVEEASKIAPTVVFDGMLPLKERFPIIADIVGKKAEGEQQLKKYEEDVEAMWQKLRANGTVAEGETAVVLQYFWNKNMYVMKTGGVADLLYQPTGFAMDEKVQALQPNSGPYIQISEESMHDTLVGDYLFVLLSADKEAQKAFEELQQKPLWNSLPAVKNNKIYYIEDKWNYDDMTTSEMLLEEFPNMLVK